MANARNTEYFHIFVLIIIFHINLFLPVASHTQRVPATMGAFQALRFFFFLFVCFNLNLHIDYIQLAMFEITFLLYLFE